MSTRREGVQRVAARAGHGRLGLVDPAEAVALVACARRELLLRAHRHRLAHEDLEDCLSQATLELIGRARRGEGFSSDEHVANALEQRLLSRIHDRQRALSGRSPIEAALARALPLGDPEHGDAEAIDRRVDVERLVMLRHDLRDISALAEELSRDQRLVLASQLAHEMGPAEFCHRHGWSSEKYRKVAQRARKRLRRLLHERSEAPQGGQGGGQAHERSEVLRGGQGGSQVPTRALHERSKVPQGGPARSQAPMRPLHERSEVACPAGGAQSDKGAGTHL